MPRKTNKKLQELLLEDKDLLRELMQVALQEVLEAVQRPPPGSAEVGDVSLKSAPVAVRRVGCGP